MLYERNIPVLLYTIILTVSSYYGPFLTGFMLLSSRLRSEDEVLVIKEVIEKQFKRSIDPNKLFGLSGNGGLTTSDSVNVLKSELPEEFEHIVWTPELMRMGVLIHRAIIFQEPVLLVGNTG